MLRFVLAAGGFMAGFAALMIWRDRQKSIYPIPAKQAADRVCQPWDDHHARA
ncbi:MAG TPA: hypothetical protein VI320_34755 [Terracidiphilus sp.]